MATANSQQEFPGIFKEVYLDKVSKLIFPFAIMQEKHAMEEAEMIGDAFVASPRLQLEHGFSYAPSTGSGALITFNAPVAGYIGRAKVQSYAIYLRSQIEYGAASRAAQRGKRAVESAYRALMENMVESFQRRLEHSLLYGKQGLGVLSGNASGVMTITNATWSAIWIGLEGAILEAFDSTTNSANQHNTDLTISSVNTAGKTITVTSGSANASVTTGDILYFKGARTANTFAEAAGLDVALTNTGTLHEISASSYSAWKSQSHNTAGDISELSVGAGVVKCANAGLMEQASLLLNPTKANVLLQEQMAKRMFDSSYSTDRAKSGSRYLEFYNVNGSSVEIIPHPFIREGEAHLYPTRRLHRIGSTDITGELDNLGEFVLHVADKNAYEVRMMSDCAFFLEAPAMACKYTNIS